MSEIKFKLKDGCNHCIPKLNELNKILDDFGKGNLPRDITLTLELNSDWFGGLVWHLNKVEIRERKKELSEEAKPTKMHKIFEKEIIPAMNKILGHQKKRRKKSSEITI